MLIAKGGWAFRAFPEGFVGSSGIKTASDHLECHRFQARENALVNVSDVESQIPRSHSNNWLGIRKNGGVSADERGQAHSRQMRVQTRVFG